MEMSEVDLIKKVNFGDIDGLYDPKIQNYFVDFGFVDSVINKDSYFVVGRKGTGKSALYNYIEKTQQYNDVLISNLSFSEFPFEKLLQLTDDQFSKPNQYQSIWKNIILSEFAKLIITDESSVRDDIYKELKRYVDYTFGKNLIDLHKKITRNTEKTEAGLSLKGNIFNLNNKSNRGSEKDFEDSFNNITKINSRLQELITDYLKIHEINKYIIQFDQLDDNYNKYTKLDSYFQCIISLFKSLYNINQTFRNRGISSKAVAYIRSDIFYAINSYDSESARWGQFEMELNWTIVNKTDWDNPRLKKMLNKRIIASIPRMKGCIDPFEKIFNNESIKLKNARGKFQDVFKYMIHRSFHRPRDVIQFCIFIRHEVMQSGTLYFRTIKNAEKKYSLWLLSELENEISPVISDTEALYDLLRLFGRKSYSIFEFKNNYKKFKPNIKMEEEELLKFLYNLGIITNVNYKNGRYAEVFSIIRNERSVFNRDLKIVTHPGFYFGLYTSKFMKK